MGVATELTPPKQGKLLDKWEPIVLVLLSLALQVILALLGNQRKRTNKTVIRIIIWSAYMAADSVATFTLGVISTNLHCALENDGPLDASIELATFWAPFLLLHLGGPDTITAFALQDTELWLRHFSNLIVQTGLALYIFFGVMKRSRLSTLSAMMLGAGVIKYGERTLCLWFASYNWRRSQAIKDFNMSTSQPQLEQSNKDETQPVQLDEELFATQMFQKTEHMFADVLSLPQDDGKSTFKIIVQKNSCSVVSKLITMELELMYENLYTKAKVIHSRWGLALRLFSFLLTLITLISFSFSCLHPRHNYSTFQLSVTLLLLVVAILLEGYAAFVYLTSCRTILWLREHGMNTASKVMKCLSTLRTPSWSNSMDQYSLVNSSLGPDIADPSSGGLSIFCEMFVFTLKTVLLPLAVHNRPVKDYVKEGIHEYLNQAEVKYNGGQFSIVNSRGRVPLTTWKEQYYGNDHSGGAEVHPTIGLNFDMEFGEMVILWHIVTEVCYYLDYDSLNGEKGNTNPSEVYRDWKMSKYLSRYLMHLHVVSSDMLPPRGPVSELKFFKYFYDCLILGPDTYEYKNTSEMSNPEEERKGKAAYKQQKKQRRKRRKVQLCKNYHDKMLEPTGTDPRNENPIRVAAFNLVKALFIEEVDPQTNASKLNRNWKLLSEVWIELLASAANQCRGNQHAQHLSQSGEFLTHVWVHLGHLGLIEPW